MFSPTISELALSRSMPPYCSGVSVPSRPSSPQRWTRVLLSAQSLFSSRSSTGRTSFSAKSLVVRAIILCSSLMRSGVNTVSCAVPSSSQAPPRGAAVAVAVVMIRAPCLCVAAGRAGGGPVSVSSMQRRPSSRRHARVRSVRKCRPRPSRRRRTSRQSRIGPGVGAFRTAARRSASRRCSRAGARARWRRH